MRLAGTCSRYSNSAIPQLASAARYHGRSAMFRRWAYQANVMKTLEQTSNSAARYTTAILIMLVHAELGIHRPAGAGDDAGNRGHIGLGGAEVHDAGAEQEAPVEHRVG